MVVSRSQLNVDHGEKRKHERLYEGNEDAQSVKNDRDAVRHHVQEDSKYGVIAHHVPAKAKRQGKGPENMGDQLDHEHRRPEPPDRSEEMLQITEAVNFQADEIVIDENEDPQRE